MEKVLLLFSSSNTLEQESIRQSFIRIPEVTVPLRTAQDFLDKFSSVNIDLVNFAGSSAEEFSAQPQVKNLVLSLIQWGLYKRFVGRSKVDADWMIGDARGSSGLMALVLGRMNFSEFLWDSSLAEGNPDASSGQDLPGKALTSLEYRIYSRDLEGRQTYNDMNEVSLDRWRLVEKCISDLGARRVVTLGPATDFSGELMRRRSLLEFDLMESTELDPQLHWLWSETGSAPV